jgi:hypothetical protein
MAKVLSKNGNYYYKHTNKNRKDYLKKYRKEWYKKMDKNHLRINSMKVVCKREKITTQFKNGDEILDWLFKQKNKDGLVRCHLSNAIITEQFMKDHPTRYSIDRPGSKKHGGDGIRGGHYVDGNMMPCLYEHNKAREAMNMTVEEYKKYNFIMRMENLGLKVDMEKLEKRIIKDNKPSMFKRIGSFLKKIFK